MKFSAFLVLILCLVALPCLAKVSNPGVFNVAQYGAKGDGVSDDTAAIQKAIAEASKTGGVVQLGSGKYRITGSLKVEATGVRLRGLGRAISTIFADGPDFHAVIVGSDAKEVQHVDVSDMTIDRAKEAKAEIVNLFFARVRYGSMDNLNIGNPGGDAIYVGSKTAPDITGCISINRIWVSGCRRSLVVAKAADVLISHMYAGHNDVAVYLTDGANNVRLSDSVFLTSRASQGKHGLVSDGGFMQEVKGCVFEETSEEVIKVTDTIRFYFHDNWLNANPEFPMIRFKNVHVFSLRNTRFGGSGTSCIELDGCGRGDVTGNNMESSRGIGLIVDGGHNFEINNNQSTGNDKEGIRLQNGVHSSRLTGNHINGTEAAIHVMKDAGDKLIIKENFLTHGKDGKGLVNESEARAHVKSTESGCNLGSLHDIMSSLV